MLFFFWYPMYYQNFKFWGYLINFIAPYYWDFNHRKIKSEQKSIVAWNYQAPSKQPFSVRVNRHRHQTINNLGFVGPISSVNSSPFLLSPSSPLVQYFKNSLKIWTVLSSTTLQKRGPRSDSAQGPYFSNSHSRVGGQQMAQQKPNTACSLTL